MMVSIIVIVVGSLLDGHDIVFIDVLVEQPPVSVHFIFSFVANLFTFWVVNNVYWRSGLNKRPTY